MRSSKRLTMRKALGNCIGFLGRGSSHFTLIIGVVYMWYHHPVMHLKFSECGLNLRRRRPFGGLTQVLKTRMEPNGWIATTSGLRILVRDLNFSKVGMT